MSEPNIKAQPAASPAAATTTTPPKPQAPPKPQNPALRMMGIPNLPKKLPSRNWMIFLGITGAISAAVIYDKREKNRATAKWARTVAPLAKEKLAEASQLPRKLTIYIESPPGDGLRVAQDHFIEYVKPVLAASGLDWEFVQARQQGDTRAAIATKIRMQRMAEERPDEPLPQTDDTLIEGIRKSKNMAPYEGVKGDIVIGRHTWKEYIRGLHEGWLGPLDAPVAPTSTIEEKPTATETEENKPEGEEKKEEEKKEEKKPDRPPQPVPHNTINDYQLASLPAHIPNEFSPSTQIPIFHRLGFRHTFVRLGWFFNRRKLADDIGREVAAVCYATAREYREADGMFEQELVLQREESDWVKSVWKEKEEQEKAAETAPTTESVAQSPAPVKELIWASPMVVDERIAGRMRKFEATAEIEAKAAEVVVPEEEIEGWIKGSLRSMWRWGASSFAEKPKIPNVGDNLEDN